MIKVKLKDPTSIFRDAGQNVTIEGKETFEVQRTSTIQNALIGGALVLVSNVEQEGDKKESDPEGETEKGQPEGDKKESDATPFTKLSKADYNKLTPEEKAIYDEELKKQSGK